MLSDTVATQRMEWQASSLCCRYLIAYVDPLPMQLQEEGVALDRTAHWAIGVLADGECEVLGVWLAQPAGHVPWQELFEGLKLRGLETVRFVVCDAPAEVRVGMRGAFPRATALPSIGRLLGQSLAQMAPRFRARAADDLAVLAASDTAQLAHAALDAIAGSRWGVKHPFIVERWRELLDELAPFYTLAPRLRRVVLSGDGAVQRLHRSFDRAVERHGVFPNPEAALAFLVEALRRAERGLDARGIEAGSRVQVRTRGPSGRPRAAAPGP